MLDKARYQQCPAVQTLPESSGIELPHQPSDSPNLNLIERPWRFEREEALDSTYPGAFGPFTAAIDRCLDGPQAVRKGELEALPTHNFYLFKAHYC